jgi:hypothetical protein
MTLAKTMKSSECHHPKGQSELDWPHKLSGLFKGMPFSNCKADFFDAK